MSSPPSLPTPFFPPSARISGYDLLFCTLRALKQLISADSSKRHNISLSLMVISLPTQLHARTPAMAPCCPVRTPSHRPQVVARLSHCGPPKPLQDLRQNTKPLLSARKVSQRLQIRSHVSTVPITQAVLISSHRFTSTPYPTTRAF